MELSRADRSIETVVVGGSQAGLATGYHLKKLGLDHVILDENDSIGSTWRNRWDSLHLFTPGRYNNLPGLPYPQPSQRRPTKDDIANYLQDYAKRFELAVRTGVHVEHVSRDSDKYVLTTTDGRYEADNVVVATGAFHNPRIPNFAGDLDSDIIQMHSADYRRPSQLQDGPVLVVGAGSSGSEIALELAQHHRVWISGRDPGQEPTTANPLADRLFPAILWFVGSHIINVANPIGRKVRDKFLCPPRGIPRGRVTRQELLDGGIEWVPRTVAVDSGLPVLDDGRVLEVANVVWCTGFVTDYSWIDLPIFDQYGYPRHDRGVVESHPGLYFMGLLFQRTLTSPLVGGMGKDAEYIARQIKDRNQNPAL